MPLAPAAALGPPVLKLRPAMLNIPYIKIKS